MTTRALWTAAWLALTPLAAAAQTTGERPSADQVAPSVGATVFDVAGAPLGVIDTVIRDTRGAPQQVLVRTGGLRSQVKSLPVSSLRPREGGFGVSLRRSEFDLLPAVQRRLAA